MRREYESFFRDGGYRLMKLLVIKAEQASVNGGEYFDVNTLIRLQNGAMTAQELAWRREAILTESIIGIYELDDAIRSVLDSLPRDWGMVVEAYYGRGSHRKENGTPIRKKTAESALSAACRGIEEYMGPYNFRYSGLIWVRKLGYYLEEADFVGDYLSDSQLMKAADSMKLFRDSQEGLIYDEALEEFCEKSGYDRERYDSCWGEEILASDIAIRQEVRDEQQLSILEDRVSEGRSSVLIDRMFDMSCTLAAIREYLPEKYEKIMNFHWTRKEDRLRELFREMAAMMKASEELYDYY